MTTLTDTITQELLDAVDNPAELDAVLKKRSHSKGPLYHAVAQATTRLQQQLTDDSTEISRIKAKGKELRDQARTLENHCRELEAKGQSLEEKTRQAEASLVKVNDFLDQAKALRGLGFGPDELSRLHDLLAGMATSQGTKPEKAVDAFFRHVSQYESIVSLEMGKKHAEIATDKAKAEAERWQAEAKAAEAKAKSRKTTIDFADKLLAQSVKEGDIPHWTRILSKGGVNPECLVLALQQFGSLENLCKDRQEQVKKLETQVKELTSQLEALNEERQQVSAAIGAVRETALAEIERTAQETLQDLDVLMNKASEYAQLQSQAATLAEEIALARAFKSQEAAQWAKVPRRAIQELLAGLVLWSKADASHNAAVPVPRFLSLKVYCYFGQEAHLLDLLRWALIGAFTEEERKALASG